VALLLLLLLLVVVVVVILINTTALGQLLTSFSVVPELNLLFIYAVA
jgi:hypothetical protein